MLVTARTRSLAGALANPVPCGDSGVVDKRLQALDTLGTNYTTLYTAFAQRTLTLTTEHDASSTDVLADLAAYLNPTQ